jgi:hypothetical protein
MLELEDRIRTEVNRQAGGYVPADDLPARIEARVRHRRAVRRVGVAGAAAAVVALVVAAGALTRPTENGVITDHGPSSTAPDRSTTSTTAEATTTTTDRAQEGPDTTADTTTTEASEAPAPPPSADPRESEPPTGAPVAAGMPLHRQGVGRIVAGMTLREAAEATGNTVTPGEPIGPTSTCNTAVVEGTGMTLMVTTSGDPAADPMDGVIQQVVGGQSTVEGVRVGDAADAVHALYGTPTDTMTPFGNTYEVFEEGGFAYVVVLAPDGTVVELQSGYPTVYPEGCA